MAKEKVLKKPVKKAAAEGKVKTKKAKSGKVGRDFTLNLFVAQIVKIDGTLIARDQRGIVLQHKRRASSKVMQSRLPIQEVVSIAGGVGEEVTVTLRTSRPQFVRPLQLRGACEFVEGGTMVTTVSDGKVFVPEHTDIRVDIVAEEE